MRKQLWVCAAALLALSACAKKTETTTTTGADGTKVTKTVETPTASLTPPSRKDGLWSQTLSSDRMNQETKICIDRPSSRR